MWSLCTTSLTSCNAASMRGCCTLHKTRCHTQIATLRMPVCPATSMQLVRDAVACTMLASTFTMLQSKSSFPIVSWMVLMAPLGCPFLHFTPKAHALCCCAALYFYAGRAYSQVYSGSQPCMALHSASACRVIHGVLWCQTLLQERLTGHSDLAANHVCLCVSWLANRPQPSGCVMLKRTVTASGDAGTIGVLS